MYVLCTLCTYYVHYVCIMYIMYVLCTLFTYYVHYVRIMYIMYVLCTLCMYSLIAYSELITFPCIQLICLICVTITNHYYMYFIVKTHSALCLLLSNDNSISTLVGPWNTK